MRNSNMQNSMMGRTFNRALAVILLASATAASASAQTDFGSPLGAGAGVVPAVSPLGVPDRQGPGGRFSPTSNSGLVNARTSFLGAPGSGLSVVSPVGGSVTVSQANSVLLGRVLENAAGVGPRVSNAAFNTLADAIGNGDRRAAKKLLRTLRQMGANPSPRTIRQAVIQYNTVVARVQAAGGTPSPELLAIRQLLVATQAEAGR